MSKTTSSSAPVTRFQDQLTAECHNRGLRDPSWQIYSDRRGGRTAWSAAVTVEGRSIAARLWYDGDYINSAKEEAAQIAVNVIRSAGPEGMPQQQQERPQQRHGQKQGISGSWR